MYKRDSIQKIDVCSGLSDPDWNVEFAGYVKRNLGVFGKTLTFHRRVAERNVSSDSAESDSSDAEDGNELGNWVF